MIKMADGAIAAKRRRCSDDWHSGIVTQSALLCDHSISGSFVADYGNRDAVSGGYRNRIDRLLGNVIFFSSTTVTGALIRASTASPGLTQWVGQPWILLPMTALSGLAGSLSWWLGELVIKQLQRAGKMDVDR